MSARYGKLLLLGDSLTQQSFSIGGWGARVADHFQRRLDVINRGFSGYTSPWINVALPEIFSSLVEIDAVTIFLGANDAALPLNHRQHVPLEMYKSYLSEIITQLLDRSIPKHHVIVITPPPLIEKAWKEHSLSEGREMDRDAKVTAKYATAAKEVAMEMGVECVDLFETMNAVATTDKDKFEGFFVDGLHLSQSGSEVLSAILIPQLETVFAARPALVLPDWKDVDYNNPRTSFSSRTM